MLGDQVLISLFQVLDPASHIRLGVTGANHVLHVLVIDHFNRLLPPCGLIIRQVNEFYVVRLPKFNCLKIDLIPSERHSLSEFTAEGITDVDTVLTRGATAGETLDSFRSSVPKPMQRKKGEAPRPRPTTTVEVIKGNKVSNQTFEQ